MSTAHLKRLDQKFEDLISSVLRDIDDKDLTPEKKAERMKLIDKDPMNFCTVYYPQIFDSPFNDAHHHLAALVSGKHTVSGFRKSGKTAFCFIYHVVRPICQRKRGIYNVSLRTLDIAKERTFHLFRLITRNRLIMYDFEPDIQQQMKGYYIINGCTLVATSVETGLRNFIDDDFNRFMVSINDDLYNMTTVTSTLDNEKVENFIISEVHGQMEDDGLSITLGNSINEDCPIVRIKERFPDNHYSLPALDEEGKSNWPERFDAAYWEAKQQEIPWDVWESEYMDRPALRGDIFNRDWLRTINLNLVEITTSISVCDPSHGQSPEACNKGLATIGLTNSKQVIVQDLYLRKEGYPEFFEYVHQLRLRIPKWKVLLFENDFQQWHFAAPYYQNWLEANGAPIPMVTHSAKDLITEFRGADKESRIMTLVHPHRTGMILYADYLTGSKDYEKFRAEYLAFGKRKDKMDGLDALASAYIQIFNYVTSGSFKPTKLKQYIKQKVHSWRR